MPAARKGLETALDFCFEQSSRFRRPSGSGAPSVGGAAHLPIYQMYCYGTRWAQKIFPAAQATGNLSGKFTKYCLTRLTNQRNT